MQCSELVLLPPLFLIWQLLNKLEWAILSDSLWFWPYMYMALGKVIPLSVVMWVGH